MARRERLGIPTYYASREGVRFDGSDQSTAVQAILDRGQAGPIHLILDGSFKAKKLRVYSGTTVEGLGNGTKITQATASSVADCYIIANAHRISPYAGSIIDQDIVIRNLYLDGQARNGVTGPGGDRGHTPDGSGVWPLTIWGCNNFRVENVYVYDPALYGVSLANVFGGVVRNITTIVPGALVAWSLADLSTACVQVDGPAADLLIEGLYGATGDDFCALNATDGQVATGTTVPVLWPYYYYGSIERVTIRGVYPTACPNVFRWLSGAPGIGGPTAHIDQVIVEDVVGNSYARLFIGERLPGNGIPAVGSITLRNWKVNYLPSSLGTMNNMVDGAIRSLTIQGIDLGNRHTNVGQIVYFYPDAALGRLEISDLILREDASEVATTFPIVAIGQGSVDELVLDRVNFVRNAATATAVVAVSGGTINRIELTNVSANNVNNVVAVSGGTVGGIDSTGLVHRGAAGNASIAQTGGTLSRVRAAGSDTALLTSGTIGSRKTDSTEDA